MYKYKLLLNILQKDAPWCGHCEALAPEYGKAATLLYGESSEIRLGKVDATEHSELAERYEVTGYPTIKFFKNGVPMNYGGGRNADAIVNWLKKKTGPPAFTITTIAELTKFKVDNKIVVMGVFKDLSSDFANAFLNIAESIDSVSFGISSEKELFTELNIKGSMGIKLFKHFDEGSNTFQSEFNENEIKKFISSNRLPLVSEFNKEVRVLNDLENFISYSFLFKENGYAI